MTTRGTGTFRPVQPVGIAGLLLAAVACAEEPTPPLKNVELVFWEDQSWESGGSTTRLTIWANGDSEVRVVPGAAYGAAGATLMPRDGWEKLDTEFVTANPLSAADAADQFAAAVRAGISLMHSEDPEYLDGGGVLLGAVVKGELHQATIPVLNEHLAQRARFDAIAGIFGELPGPEQAFEVAPKIGLSMYDEQAKIVLRSLNIDRGPVSVTFHAMALNRLEVVVPSRNPEVSDLVVTLVDAGGGWELESPPREAIAAWLEKSGG